MVGAFYSNYGVKGRFSIDALLLSAYFLLAEILNFQGSTHLIGVGSFSQLFMFKLSLIKKLF